MPRVASGGAPIRILVSACLLGERVRYDGADAASGDPRLGRWLAEGRVVPFCPEVAGGLAVPRPAAELRGGDGGAVLSGTAHVVTRDGAPVTEAYVRGARAGLERARIEGCRLAILKDGSPSCGSRFIYDGRFVGARRAGPGVTSALLEEHGIRVFAETQIGDAADYLAHLEAGARATSGVPRTRVRRP